MFGLLKKNKGYDLLLIKPKNQQGERSFYQILFPTVAAGDFVQLMVKLQKSKLNRAEILGDLGEFVILSHIEWLEKITVMDEVWPESEPLPFQDFSNQLLLRFNQMLSGEEMDEETDAESDEELLEDGQEDLVYFIGEFTLMRDGSF